MTERRRSEEDLRIAREEAVAANLAKSEFLSRTSHELRTPLNAILGFGQLLEIDEEDFAKPHRDAIHQIAKAGRHLLALINDLLNISSIEAGAEEIEIEEVNIADLLEEVRDLADPIVGAAGLTFEIDLPPADTVVQADKRRTTQVILNLISNAAKYNVDGSFVKLGAKDLDGEVAVFVEDDGPGVDPANRSRLFTAFDRLGQHRSSKSEGTGLGLALSKSLVESMGGVLDYTPLNPGARFWFSLSRKALPLAARQAAE
jgi:signal transduction histidine kinase